MANKKVVVAFSGGLDTSYTVMKLTQDGWDVYAWKRRKLFMRDERRNKR